MKKGDCEKAVQEYEKAIAGNPNLAAAYYNLGNSYNAKGMFDEAIAQYEKALAINPDVAEAHNNLGNAYYRTGNYSAASDHFERALTLGYKVDPELLEFVKHNQPYF